MISVLAIGHFLLFTGAGGDIYYGSAALMPVIALFLIANVPRITDLGVDVMRYCGMSWVVNLVGWVGWGIGAEPTGYNMVSIILYLYAIIILTRNDDGCRRAATMDWWATLFRSDSYQHFIQRTKDKKKA